MTALTRRTLLAGGAGLLLGACSRPLSTAIGVGNNVGGPDRVGRVIPVNQRTIHPKVAGTTLQGTHLDIAAWAGAPVVINFWGSWCTPCREESPELRRTALSTIPLGAHFVGIDVLDDVASARAFEANFKIPYPSISDKDGLIETTFGAAVPRAVPTTHVLDAKGRVAVQFIGKITFAGLQPTILQVLTETNPDLNTVAPTPSTP